MCKFSPVTALVVIACSASLFLAAPVQAQSAYHPSRFKVNFGFPTDGDTSDVLGIPVFGLGFSTDLPGSVMKAGPAVVSFYLDYQGKSKSKNNTRVDLSYVGFGPSVRFYPSRREGASSSSSAATSASFFLTGGFGAYYTRYFLQNQITGSYAYDTSGVKFGGKVGIGADVAQGGFVEVEYVMPGSSKANMINLNLGVRFGAGK